MCGICGVWNHDGSPVDTQRLRLATDLLRHRGPDDEGYLLVNTSDSQAAEWGGRDTLAQLQLPRLEKAAQHHGDLAFGFRRLAIIDLSAAGHQPMRSAQGRYWIVFNGEIYNYLELRAELITKGHEFRTQTDTEVILASYQEWGRDCLSHFNGMWAFALWDAERNDLFCARDRLGIKPFYYYCDGRSFVFASEIKAILALALQTRQMNQPYLAHFLMTGLLDFSEQTFYERVRSLPPAHYLCLDSGARTPALKRYWDVNPEEISSKYDYLQPEKTFLELLTDSIRLRLRSDVPVGTCLSGGLDSSAIVALSSKMIPQGINSFSSVYDHPAYSEKSFIDLVVQATNTRAHLTSPDPQEFFEVLRKIIWHMDEPVAGMGVYSQWFVMELARQSVTVLLDGQGGDELFAGYFPYLPLHLANLARQAIRQGRPDLMLRLFQDCFAIVRDARRHFFPELNLGQFLAKTANRLSGRRGRADLFLSSEMVAQWDSLNHQTVEPRFPHDPVNQSLYRDLTRDSIPALLHYEDRNSMAFSIEARVPLLDYRLVEFALGLPGERKIKGSTTKHFMREALKGVLPEAIRTRTDKKGYPTPLALWLRGPLKTETGELLQEHFRRREFYNLPAVQQMWRDHQAGAADHSWQIFRWLTTEMWLQNFIDAKASVPQSR